jgi:8-oxo-dGTP diphosphatase
MTYCLYVDGICLKDDQILLVKRLCEPFSGFWHVVGGEVQENEALAEALRREFKEETDLDVKVGDMICWRIEESFDRTKIIFVFEINSFEGKIKLNHENEEYGWFVSFPHHSVYDYSRFIVKER